ncbi:hypothetical protein [Lachnospira multipara]|jgi:hypothetical protein|uniref:hypothetical protein n=1 Tax=Lachnospira multipara TaxID=28051 RepID=UPI000488B7F2|nr:hypothetical protein [Lachnospira multipara]
MKNWKTPAIEEYEIRDTACTRGYYDYSTPTPCNNNQYYAVDVSGWAEDVSGDNCSGFNIYGFFGKGWIW